MMLYANRVKKLLEYRKKNVYIDEVCLLKMLVISSATTYRWRRYCGLKSKIVNHRIFYKVDDVIKLIYEKYFP